MKRLCFNPLLLILMTFMGAATAGTQKPNLALPSTVYLFAAFRGNGDGLRTLIRRFIARWSRPSSRRQPQWPARVP